MGNKSDTKVCTWKAARSASPFSNISQWKCHLSMVAFSGQLKTTRSSCFNASSTCRNTRSSCWNARRTCACTWRVICFWQQFHYLCCCRFSLHCSRIHFLSQQALLVSQQPLLVFHQLTTCVAATTTCVSATHYLCFSNLLVVLQQLLLVFQQLTSCVVAAVIFAAAINDCLLGITTVVIYLQVMTTVATPSKQSLVAAAKITAAATQEVVAETQVVSCWNTSSELLKHK